MRRRDGRHRCWSGLAVAGLLLAGCSQQPKAKVADNAPMPDAADQAGHSDEALAHVESLKRGLANQHGDVTLDETAPRVLWIDASKSQPLKAPWPAPAPQPASATPPASAAPIVAASPSLNDALAALVDHLRSRDGTPLSRAAGLSILSLALPVTDADVQAALAALAPHERDAIERYRHVMAALHQRAVAGTELDRAALFAELDALFEHTPLRIRSVRLCQRVRGFGNYDEVDAAKLLAGREHRMIVYVELDNYRSVDHADGYEVKLAQELELFNESDGLAVWRQEPVQIVDHCRNIRRDFFVVQLIKLPARLSVGKYRLKVRVTDQHGGSVDETTMPIAVVADQSLVRGE